MTDHDDMPQSAVARWVPATVVVLALAGFVSLAWYAYHAGKQSVKEEDLLVVEADKTPMKEKPLDPGGMKFPNQDKTVFETFAPGGQQNAKVERVLPAPEEPLPKHADSSDAKPAVNDGKKRETLALAAPVTSVNASDDGDAMPEPATPEMAPVIAPVPAMKMDSKAQEAKITPVPAPTIAPVVAPVIPPVKPSLVAAPKVVAKPVVKPVAKVAEKAPVTSGTKIQLGAYKSEKEAQDAWAKIQKKFASTASKSPIIVKADLGAKGIYYRLRVGGFYSAKDAKNFCAPLAADKQPCIVATE